MTTPALPLRSAHVGRLSALVWIVVAGAVTAQQLFLAQWDSGSFRAALVGRLVMLPFWAAATPAILRSAHRWPLTGSSGLGNAIRHLGSAAVFIVLSNAVIRAPMLAREGFGAFFTDLAYGLGLFGPLALVVYATIVAIGAAIRPTPTAQPIPSEIRSEPTPAAVVPPVLSLRDGDTVRLVPIGEVDFVEADDNYIRVSTAGRIIRTRGRLSDVEGLLDPVRFLRIHRSTIVSATAIRAVISVSHGDWAVELVDGTRLRVARGRRQLLAPFKQS